jgi:hypothetical protein
MPKQCESWIFFTFMCGDATSRHMVVNSVTGVSKLFTICLDLMFAGKYMQFSLICLLPKSLVLIHVMLTTMYNPMYNTLMLPIVYIRRYICAEQT